MDESLDDYDVKNEDQLILKEISKILNRANEKDKEEILNFSRSVLDEILCRDVSAVDEEVRKKNQEEVEKLKLQGKMSIRTSDFEKSIFMMKLIAGKMDFRKKFRMILDYDPELLSATIEYFWD